MKNVVITGTTGFLGCRLARCLEGEYSVCGISHTQMDFLCEEQVKRLLNDRKAEYLIHCAAFSDTAYVEKHPEEAMSVNVRIPEILAKVCREQNVKFIYMSSDQVYNGETSLGAHSEEEELHPETEYGKQKLLMEEKVQEHCSDAVGLRLTWLYDLPDYRFVTRGNFLNVLLFAGLRGEMVKFTDREYRGVTSVWSIVEAMPAIMELPGGVYNCGCENSLNTYELACRTAKRLGIDRDIIACDRSRYPEHIRNLGMNTDKMKKNNIIFAQSLYGIDQYLNHCNWRE